MKKSTKFLYFLSAVMFISIVNLFLSETIARNIFNSGSILSSFINIIYIENTGAAFSILQDSTQFLIALSVIAIFILLFYVLKNIEAFKLKELFFLSLLSSGIIGNLYERIAFGHVRDFFELNFINFPVFNISDILINIGVVGLIVLIILTKKNINLI